MPLNIFLSSQFDPVISNEYRTSNDNYSLIWIDNLKQLKPSLTYFVTNELFDAYPIHKFQVRDRSLLKEKIMQIFVRKENCTRLEGSHDRLEFQNKTTSVCLISTTNSHDATLWKCMIYRKLESDSVLSE